MNRYLLISLAVLVTFTSTSASAVDGPKRKPGLWEIRVQAAGKTMVSQVCVDAAAEIRMNATTDDYMKQHCTKNELRQEGDKWIRDSECTFAGQHVIDHSVMTPSGDTAYHTEGKVTADAKWLGPCKPGQKPGVPMMMGR